MKDALPVLPALILAAVSLVAWLAVEFRHASPDPNPDELTPLDILQLTGKYPRG